MAKQLGPPSSVGWWWCKDDEIVGDDPWVLSHWDGATLRLYTPAEKIREWPFTWDNDDWVCVSDDAYSEVCPVEWIRAERPQ